MVKVYRVGLMEFSMTACGMKARCKDLGGWYMPMQMSMRENSRMIRHMVRASILKKVVKCMKANGNTINHMVKENKN